MRPSVHVAIPRCIRSLAFSWTCCCYRGIYLYFRSRGCEEGPLRVRTWQVQHKFPRRSFYLPIQRVSKSTGRRVNSVGSRRTHGPVYPDRMEEPDTGKYTLLCLAIVLEFTRFKKHFSKNWLALAARKQRKSRRQRRVIRVVYTSRKSTQPKRSRSWPLKRALLLYCIRDIFGG